MQNNLKPSYMLCVLTDHPPWKEESSVFVWKISKKSLITAGIYWIYQWDRTHILIHYECIPVETLHAR